jgi:hypothetical protein
MDSGGGLGWILGGSAGMEPTLISENLAEVDVLDYRQPGDSSHSTILLHHHHPRLLADPGDHLILPTSDV